MQKERYGFPGRAVQQVRRHDVWPTEVGDVREGRRGHVERFEDLLPQELFPRTPSQPLADVRRQTVHQVAVDEAVAKLALRLEETHLPETGLTF